MSKSSPPSTFYPSVYKSTRVKRCTPVWSKRIFKMNLLFPYFMTGGWRKLHNEELHNLYSSPTILRMIKSRRMRWTGHVARIGRGGMLIGYWWERQKERDHWENQDVGGGQY
jgi:hypothetical protein